jgi:hypothetical protein
MDVIWRDPPFSELGTVCCRCLQRMTVRESMKAVALGAGMYVCPGCEHPRPRLVRNDQP